jgi:aspartyl-tRNA(Asn)/glutamyl-tRNA(Gln) amidotransferase subunit C
VANIDREQLLHVARLARLELREDELERLGAQLNDILAAVSKVSELDLSDVPPTSHPLDVVNVWGEDEPAPSLTVDEALANAPDREGAFFKVPPGADPRTGHGLGAAPGVADGKGLRPPGGRS